MKKVFSKELWKKFLISMMILLSCSWVVPKTSNAVNIGGELAEPFGDLMILLGDGIVEVAHKVIKKQELTYLRCDQEWWQTTAGNIAIFSGLMAWNPLTWGLGLDFQIFNYIFNLFTDSEEMLPGQPVTITTDEGLVVTKYFYDDQYFANNSLVLPVYTVTPEEIFGGTIGLFNVNFFNPELDTNTVDVDPSVDDEDTETNIAEVLQSTIATWYKILRGIATVGMLSILVYIGIRILISSTAENKAKYKQLLVDWGVGFCLLFFMHYGMAFGNMFVDKLTEALTTIKVNTTSSTASNDVDVRSVTKNMQCLYISKRSLQGEDALDFRSDGTVALVTGDGVETEIPNMHVETITYNGEQIECVVWPTNMMGKLRVDAVYERGISGKYFGYAILFLVEVCLLVYFIYVYLKRVLYMAFLTIIAPFVALTYPLDKIKDSQSQAFNFWLKEYMFNLLLQPMHLLIYTILITSALELASENIFYSLAVLGFLIPAEKLFRQMFGFKGNTPGFIPGAAGAAVIMSGVNKILQKPKELKGDNASAGSSGSDTSKLQGSNPNKYGMLASSLNGYNGQGNDSGQNAFPTGGMQNAEELLDSQGAHGLGEMPNIGVSLDGGNNTGISINPNLIVPSGASSNAGGNRNIQISAGEPISNQAIPNSAIPSQAVPNPTMPSQSVPRRNIPQANNVQEPKSGSKARNLVNQARVFGGTMNRNMARNAKRNVISGARKLTPKVFKALPKAAGGLALGALGGSIALAAGISSGDFKTAAMGALGAGYAGYKGGSNIVQSGYNLVGYEQSWQDAWLHSKEAIMTEEEKKKKKAKEIIDSEDVQKVLDKLKISKDEKIRENMRRMLSENQNAESYISQVQQKGKITNGEDLVKTAMYGIDQGLTVEEAAMVYGLAQNQGNIKTSEMDSERLKRLRDTEYRQVIEEDEKKNGQNSIKARAEREAQAEIQRQNEEELEKRRAEIEAHYAKIKDDEERKTKIDKDMKVEQEKISSRYERRKASLVRQKTRDQAKQDVTNMEMVIDNFIDYKL